MLKSGQLLITFGPALPFESSIVWSVLYKANIELFRAISDYFNAPENIEKRNAWRSVRLHCKTNAMLEGGHTATNAGNIQASPDIIDLEKENAGFFGPTKIPMPLRLMRITSIDDNPAEIAEGPAFMVNDKLSSVSSSLMSLSHACRKAKRENCMNLSTVTMKRQFVAKAPIRYLASIYDS
jgi:hypothetical protein